MEFIPKLWASHHTHCKTVFHNIPPTLNISIWPTGNSYVPLYSQCVYKRGGTILLQSNHQTGQVSPAQQKSLCLTPELVVMDLVGSFIIRVIPSCPGKPEPLCIKSMN